MSVNAVPLLRILALHIPIVGLDIILGSVVIAADRQRQWVMVSVTAAVFNPLLNLAAIPLTQRLLHNGAIGAAVITVMTELILMVGAISLRPQGVLDKSTIQMLLRITLASLAMVPVVLALGIGAYHRRIQQGTRARRRDPHRDAVHPEGVAPVAALHENKMSFAGREHGRSRHHERLLILGRSKAQGRTHAGFESKRRIR